MKIRLPDGQKTTLSDDLPIEEKVELTRKLVEEWDSVITENWGSEHITFFLDRLANYLVWHKDPIVDEQGNEKVDTTEDKDVMSRNKTNRLYRGRKDVVFSNLNDKDKEILFGERGME